VPQLHKLIQKYNAETVIKGYKKLTKDQMIEQLRARLPHLVALLETKPGPISARKGYGGQIGTSDHVRIVKGGRRFGKWVAGTRVPKRALDPEDYGVIGVPTKDFYPGEEFEHSGGAYDDSRVYNIPPPAISYEEVGDDQLVSHRPIDINEKFKYRFAEDPDKRDSEYSISTTVFNPFTVFNILGDEKTEVQNISDGLDLYQASGVLITSQQIAEDKAIGGFEDDDHHVVEFTVTKIHRVLDAKDVSPRSGARDEYRGVSFMSKPNNNYEGNHFSSIAPYFRWKARDPKRTIVKLLWNGDKEKGLVGLTSAITKMPGYVNWGMVYTDIETKVNGKLATKYIKVFPYDEIGRVVIVADNSDGEDGAFNPQVGRLEQVGVANIFEKADYSVKMIKDSGYFETDEKLETYDDCLDFLKKNNFQLFRLQGETRSGWNGKSQMTYRERLEEHDTDIDSMGSRLYSLLNSIRRKYKVSDEGPAGNGMYFSPIAIKAESSLREYFEYFQAVDYKGIKDDTDTPFERRYGDPNDDLLDELLVDDTQGLSNPPVSPVFKRAGGEKQGWTGPPSLRDLKEFAPDDDVPMYSGIVEAIFEAADIFGDDEETIRVEPIKYKGQTYYIDVNTGDVYDPETSEPVPLKYLGEGNFEELADFVDPTPVETAPEPEPDTAEPQPAPEPERDIGDWNRGGTDDEEEEEFRYDKLIKDETGEKFLLVDGDELEAIQSADPEDRGYHIDGFYYVKSSESKDGPGDYSYDVVHNDNLYKTITTLGGLDKKKFKK